MLESVTQLLYRFEGVVKQDISKKIFRENSTPGKTVPLDLCFK